MYCVVQRSVYSMASIIKVHESTSHDNDANLSSPSSLSLLAQERPLLTSPVTTTFLQQASVLTRLRQCCDDFSVRLYMSSFITINKQQGRDTGYRCRIDFHMKMKINSENET
ncbi:hypothetical protein WUBG_01035 [Wuchereria bancrofti]|uniref:Uncharacterized protein n=1 Tax=Wuchereria bancrofti TaxID=6293 RepID=J9F0R4_WUCBA|nr:hypothetical protein WUBG_01035 [Wuchereria bancrofti]VDM15516.1 unnamed protein product [Wuchereria bancrofti]